MTPFEIILVVLGIMFVAGVGIGFTLRHNFPCIRGLTENECPLCASSFDPDRWRI